MDFFLKFESSKDVIPFSIIKNERLFSWFLEKINTGNNNRFLISQPWINEVTRALETLDNNIRTVNDVINNLLGYKFRELDDINDYLDQDFLNKTHCDWVKSQEAVLNIDALRTSDNPITKEMGESLHHQYPGDIRNVRLAPLLQKLDYIDIYEDINMSIHRLEALLGGSPGQDIKIDFANDDRYDMIRNEKYDETEFTNDNTNFSFSYTYLGRQNYDKWLNYDNNLDYDDDYNYEKLELAFSLHLGRTETIPFSEEFLSWCKDKNIKPIWHLAIANIPDLQNRLFEYRKIVYTNGKAGNYASLSLTNQEEK